MGGVETTFAAIVIAVVTAIPPTIAAIAAALAARHAALKSTQAVTEVQSSRVITSAAAEQASVAAGHAETAAAASAKQSDAIHRLVNSNLNTLREELKIKDARIGLQHDDLVAKEREIQLLTTRIEQLHAIIESLKVELQSVTRGESASDDAGR